MPFYKRNGDELISAPNFVIGPGFELRAETKDQHEYPVDGWYWFDTLDDALAGIATKPSIVSRFQGRAALMLAGKLDYVEALIAQADPMTKLAWNEAVEWRRDSPMVATLGGALGMTNEDIDELFRVASGIVA